MVFFVGEAEPLFCYEFPKAVKFLRNDGEAFECGCISVEEKGMFAFLKGGWGNCISGADDNNRHDLHHKCLYEVEYDFIKEHLSEKQRALIEKLYAKKKFAWAGERTYISPEGEIWVLCGTQGNSYSMRGDTGFYKLVNGKDFHTYKKVELN